MKGFSWKIKTMKFIASQSWLEGQFWNILIFGWFLIFKMAAKFLFVEIYEIPFIENFAYMYARSLLVFVRNNFEKANIFQKACFWENDRNGCRGLILTQILNWDEKLTVKSFWSIQKVFLIDKCEAYMLFATKMLKIIDYFQF